MPRPTHYTPAIRRDLVGALYHERIRRGIPMTRLVNQIIEQALSPGTSGRVAEMPHAPQPTTKPLT